MAGNYLFDDLNSGVQQGLQIAQVTNQLAQQKQAVVAQKQKEEKVETENRFSRSLELLKNKSLPRAFKQDIYDKVVRPAGKGLYGFDLPEQAPNNMEVAASEAHAMFDAYKTGKLSAGDLQKGLALIQLNADPEDLTAIKSAYDVSGAKESVASQQSEKMARIRQSLREAYKTVPLPALTNLRSQLERAVAQGIPGSPEVIDASEKMAEVDEVLRARGLYGDPNKRPAAPAAAAVPAPMPGPLAAKPADANSVLSKFGF